MKQRLLFSQTLEAEIDSMEYLIKVNEKCEWVWKIYIKYVICGFGASTVGSCFGSVLSFMLSNEPFNIENMYLQFKIMYVIYLLFLIILFSLLVFKKNLLIYRSVCHGINQHHLDTLVKVAIAFLSLKCI